MGGGEKEKYVQRQGGEKCLWFFFFLERRTAIKPVKIKTIRARQNVALVFVFFFSRLILSVEFRNQNVSHQQPNEKAPVYS